VRVQWRETSVDVREAGAGPCVILLHGYPLDGAMWSGVARALATRFRVLKPDLPGHGENPAAAPPELDGHAEFVEAIVKDLPPPVGLAGFSMGGYVSFALLRRDPANLRALALVDTRAEADDEEGKKRRNESIEVARSGGVAKIADLMLPSLLAEASLASIDLTERLRRIILRQKPESIEADLVAMRDRREAGDLLPQIRVPTVVVVGEQDTLTPPALSEKMAGLIPGASLVKIPGAGHLTPMERPGAVAAALGDFFAGALTS
jgi:pimeloyl-ACP methyl ester carboxylesterase